MKKQDNKTQIEEEKQELENEQGIESSVQQIINMKLEIEKKPQYIPLTAQMKQRQLKQKSIKCNQIKMYKSQDFLQVIKQSQDDILDRNANRFNITQQNHPLQTGQTNSQKQKLLEQHQRKFAQYKQKNQELHPQQIMQQNLWYRQQKIKSLPPNKQNSCNGNPFIGLVGNSINRFKSQEKIAFQSQTSTQTFFNKRKQLKNNFNQFSENLSQRSLSPRENIYSKKDTDYTLKFRLQNESKAIKKNKSTTNNPIDITNYQKEIRKPTEQEKISQQQEKRDKEEQQLNEAQIQTDINNQFYFKQWKIKQVCNRKPLSVMREKPMQNVKQTDQDQNLMDSGFNSSKQQKKKNRKKDNNMNNSQSSSQFDQSFEEQQKNQQQNKENDEKEMDEQALNQFQNVQLKIKVNVSDSQVEGQTQQKYKSDQLQQNQERKQPGRQNLLNSSDSEGNSRMYSSQDQENWFKYLDQNPIKVKMCPKSSIQQTSQTFDNPMTPKIFEQRSLKTQDQTRSKQFETALSQEIIPQYSREDLAGKNFQVVGKSFNQTQPRGSIGSNKLQIKMKSHSSSLFSSSQKYSKRPQTADFPGKLANINQKQQKFQVQGFQSPFANQNYNAFSGKTRTNYANFYQNQNLVDRAAKIKEIIQIQHLILKCKPLIYYHLPSFSINFTYITYSSY